MATINQAIDHYIQTQPAYAAALQVYRAIRQLQEEVLVGLGAAAPVVDPPVAQQRLLAGQPLLGGTPPVIEPGLFEALAVDLGQRLPDHWPLRSEVECFLHYLGHPSSDSLQPVTLLAGYISDRQNCLTQLVAETEVSAAAIAYVLQTTLGPFLEQAAVPLRPYVTDTTWTKGICPICGSPPLMAKLAARGGQRRLGCGLCQTEWVYARTGCLFCGESRPDNLPQFHLDGDRARRVDACRTCRNYLKTVDERELRRPAQLLVEDIVTAHLDILAQQQGYQ